MQSLQSAGLASLAEHYNVISYDQATMPPCDKPLLLVGDLPADRFRTLSDPCLHLCPLPISRCEPRWAASGYATPLVEAILDKTGVPYLGEAVENACRAAAIERATLAVQTNLAAEAVALGLAAGVSGDLLYSAIAGAAGSSWSFKSLVPGMIGLSKDLQSQPSLEDAMKDISDMLHLAAKTSTPLPLASLSNQMYQWAERQFGSGRMSRIFALYSSARGRSAHVNGVASVEPRTPSKVAFVGLGAMGFGMANILRLADINLVGYDAWLPSRDRYVAVGGVCGSDLAECAADAEVLLLMVVNAAQAESVLFEGGAAAALPRNAVILLMSTVAPSQAIALQEKLRGFRPDLNLVDAPVSGGTPRAASGDLTILCAGLDEAGPRSPAALCVLQHLSQSQHNTDNLILISGGAGKGASVKLVNQHLAVESWDANAKAGTHIISVAEALVLAAKLDLPLCQFRKLMLSGPAWSWMMGHRGQNMLDGLIQPPTSMISIFVKDMRIVVDEAAEYHTPVPLASHVAQQFIAGSANGWGCDDDSSIVRLWDGPNDFHSVHSRS